MLGIEALWKIMWEALAYGVMPLAGLAVLYYLVQTIYNEITLPRCSACGRAANESRLGRSYCRKCARRGDAKLMRNVWRNND